MDKGLQRARSLAGGNTVGGGLDEVLQAPNCAGTAIGVDGIGALVSGVLASGLAEGVGVHGEVAEVVGDLIGFAEPGTMRAPARGTVSTR